MSGSEAGEAEAGLWLRRYREAPDARFAVLCFPPAGGGAHTFRPWARQIPASADVSLYAVQYPGRFDRAGEPAATAVAELAEPVARVAAGLPACVLLLGHSLGAVIAYEVAARMEAADRPPLALAVVGRESPDAAVPPPQRTDEELLALARSLGGLPEEALADEELRELLLAPLRADSRMLAGHLFSPVRAIEAPILAFRGRADPGCGAADLAGWRAATLGECAVRTLPGGHFPPPEAVARILGGFLAFAARHYGRVNEFQQLPEACE